MAEITRPRTGELLRKLFEILMAAPNGLKAKDALAALTSKVQLTPYEAGDYPNGGGRRFDKIVRFATVDTTKAGWLVKAKGQWSITDAGRAAHKKFQDPEAFYKEAIRLYRQWKSNQPPDDDVPPSDDTTLRPGREVNVTYEVAEEQAWSEVESFLAQMQPYEFQNLVAALLKGMGYHVAWIAPPGKDGGIDILAFSDPLGTQPPRIKVQVKRQQSTVSVDGLRSFLAVLSDDDVGIFVNTGGFTKDAMEEARTQANRRVTLVDLERLFELWIEHYDDLEDDARRRMPLKPIYFLAPQE
jgi:restriction system protein